MLWWAHAQVASDELEKAAVAGTVLLWSELEQLSGSLVHVGGLVNTVKACMVQFCFRYMHSSVLKASVSVVALAGHQVLCRHWPVMHSCCDVDYTTLQLWQAAQGACRSYITSSIFPGLDAFLSKHSIINCRLDHTCSLQHSIRKMRCSGAELRCSSAWVVPPPALSSCGTFFGHTVTVHAAHLHATGEIRAKLLHLVMTPAAEWSAGSSAVLVVDLVWCIVVVT